MAYLLQLGQRFFPSTNPLHDGKKKPYIIRFNECSCYKEPHTTTKTSIRKASKILVFNYLNSIIEKTTILLHYQNELLLIIGYCVKINVLLNDRILLENLLLKTTS